MTTLEQMTKDAEMLDIVLTADRIEVNLQLYDQEPVPEIAREIKQLALHYKQLTGNYYIRQR